MIEKEYRGKPIRLPCGSQEVSRYYGGLISRLDRVVPLKKKVKILRILFGKKATRKGLRHIHSISK
jgi:hypothetical protein